VASMDDIAVLTGGRIFYSAAKVDLEDFRVEDLGQAPRLGHRKPVWHLWRKGDSARCATT
jgi:hypothetical protein